MKQMSLAEIIGKNLRKALWILLVATLATNAVLVIYDVQTLTRNVYDSFSSQLQNVARVSSQRGDMLSLQKDLEAVAAPLAETFSVDVEITDLGTNKMIVDIPGQRGMIAEIFTRTVISVLEVNPVGSLKAKITFDISRIVLVALIKALLSSVLLLVAVFAVRRYVEQLNRQNLDPIDRFSKWLDVLGPEGLVKKDLEFPTEGLQEDLKVGLESLAKKISELTTEVAALETERQVGLIARRVAHDIRSPLSALNIMSQSVENLTSEQRDVIQQVSSRINGIADNLLEQTKAKVVTAPNIRIHEGSLNLKKALGEILQEKTLEYQKKTDLIFDARISEDFVNATATFEEHEFKRIISNLINNSVEGIDGPGSIFIEAKTVGKTARISVLDTGKGIPELILPLLTKEPLSTKPEGNGIGLFLAAEMLKAHGHGIGVESREGVGTKVTLSFTSV